MKEKMRQLIEQLNHYTHFYDMGNPLISDAEWDKLYFDLQELEKKSGYTFPDSPTQNISYDVVSELKKITHNHPMLSLQKTKSLDELNEFCGNRTAFLSLKLDGLTCSLYYANGRLQRAETRGNGVIGEDITHNAMVIPSIPKRINYLDELVVDGEIICLDQDFKPFSDEYANSRNFAAGSIRLLDSRECAKRNLTFVAWEMVKGYAEERSAIKRLQYLQKLNFHIVPFEVIDSNWWEKSIENGRLDIKREEINQQLIDSLKLMAKIGGYPIDGLVAKYDDIDYGRSLGATAHHRRDGLAFKFFDEAMETTLLDIEWGMGRTGQLTPVAILEPIEIDGSIISRASLHNINILRATLNGSGWKGQKVGIAKRNMIIPQIEWAEEDDDRTKAYFMIPHNCPVCGGETKVRDDFLWCTNPSCSGKFINQLDHFCGKKGLDIKGLSKATLEKLVDWGWVSCFADLFKLQEHMEEWAQKPGFGVKSVVKLLDAIDEAQYNSTHESFISAIGIPLIGRTMVKELMKNGIPTYETLYNLVQQGQDFSQFNGFGYEKSESLLRFDYTEANKAYALMTLITPEPEEKKENTLEGKSIVITGTLKTFKNRAELQRVIEAAGGKVVGAVSKNTSYLINNDIESTSAKNQTAKRLGVPIITEENFLKLI